MSIVVYNEVATPIVPTPEELLILGLFARGEQGGAWDFTNPNGLYQDAAGTTPVTEVGQPVGLVLDRRFGLARGAELVPQPLNLLSGWTGSVNVTGTTASGFTASGAATVHSVVLTVGVWYEVSVEATSTAATGVFGVFNNSNGLTNPIITSTPSDGLSGKAVFKAVASSLGIRQPGAGSATISSLSVRELPGNHLTQSTTAARPTFTADGALHDGVDDYLVAADAEDWTFLHDGTGGYMAASSEYREGGGVSASYFGTQTTAAASLGASTGLQSLNLARTFSRVTNGSDSNTGSSPTGSFPIGLMGTQEFEVNTTGIRAWSRGELYRDEPFGGFVPSTDPPANPLTTLILVNGASVVRRRMLAISRSLANDELALVRSWLMEGVE